MQAEVIAIGDELTSGQRLDTNSQWISCQLGELGIGTIRHTTVGDDLASNIEALQLATRRADVVICSGGLGPTLDDLTRQAIATAFECPLVLDDASLAHIQAMFANRNREMPERNRVQAMFPRGSRIIPNPHGSAPGIDLFVRQESQANTSIQTSVIPGSRIFALPGVPAELKQMWFGTVVERLEKMLGSQLGPLHYHSVKLFGIGESDVEVRLPDLIDRQRVPTVGITVSRATITLRITSRAADASEFQALIAPTLAEIREALGELIFGAGDDELEHVVLSELRRRGESIACLEVGAASWLSDWLLQAAGTADEQLAMAAMQNFAGGISFPTVGQAERWLLAEKGPAEDIWSQLATQTSSRFSADWGLAVGSYPTSQSMEKSNGSFDFHFAVAYDGQVHVEQRTMGGHPDVLGPRVAKTGLDIVRKFMR